MKTFTLITTILLTASVSLAQYNKIDTSFYSQTLGEEKMVDVYFPPGYDENPDLFYSVIYYLHGWTQNQNDISEMLYYTELLINNNSIQPVIMVCADNSPGPFGGSMYTNSILWGDYEEYMTNDLINWIESSFRAMPSKDHRALLGNSMGGYGAFRYGILYKDKFRALAAAAIAVINLTDSYVEYTRQKIMLENPGASFYYDYYNTGISTMGMFLFCGAFSPNYNTPQTYINPRIVEFTMDENGAYIDTIVQKFKNNSIAHLIHQLSPDDSVGILFGCGSADENIYPCHIAFKDTLNMLGLPYEFYDHSGGHTMPDGFKERALIFIDSLLMPPVLYTGVEEPSNQNIRFGMQSYPNPFDQSINISYTLSELSDVHIHLFDALGTKVKEIDVGQQQSGTHKIHINMLVMPSGVYFIQLYANNLKVTRKVLKIR
ncbi:MAG: hypothetical protein C0591_13315 [Marinilabiliales bacterium]|nr:MAG: hypothetical protein C0591_13315 [Marinilabiliales bacterium]